MNTKSKRKQSPKKTPKKTDWRARLKVSQVQRTLGYVVMAFLLGAVVGFSIGYKPGTTGGHEGKADAFGRLPGDEHYLHKHP